jgi:hypothetical protein
LHRHQGLHKPVSRASVFQASRLGFQQSVSAIQGAELCRAGFLACTNRGAEQTFSDAQSKLSLTQGVGIQQRPNDTLQDQRWSHSVGSACARHEEYDVNCSKARNNTCATLLLYFAPLRVAPCAALHCSASA